MNDLILIDKSSWFKENISPAWRAGISIYKILHPKTVFKSVESWGDVFDYLESLPHYVNFDMISFWGLGAPGVCYINRIPLGERNFLPGYYASRSSIIGARLNEGGLVYFRSSATFHGKKGQRFAAAVANHLQVDVAGHTFKIGGIQSGYNKLRPKEYPSWSMEEGSKGWSELKDSSLFEKGTITCLTARGG